MSKSLLVIEWGILKGTAVEVFPDLQSFIAYVREIGGEENSPNRQVAYDEIDTQRVSTIFLHVNLSREEPNWFETVVFGGPHDYYQRRYATWAQAFAGHHQIVGRLKRGEHPGGAMVYNTADGPITSSDCSGTGSTSSQD